MSAPGSLPPRMRSLLHTVVVLSLLLGLMLPLGRKPLPARAGREEGSGVADLSLLPGTFDSPLSTTFESPLAPPETEATAEGGGVTLATYSTTESAGWRLLYNPPVVALFSGAATYEYTFDLPPARNGLQPMLRLSYNSRRVDGVLGWVESGWVGMGWSVDLMDVVREGIKYKWGNTEWIDYDNRFTLLINGTGYELEPGEGVAAGQPGRYHARNAPHLYVELRDDAPLLENGGNVTGLYWIVRTPDGTEYRLGYTTNSEQVLYRTSNGEDWYAGGYDAGRAKNYATYRWRLDEAEDVYGNRMEVTYREAHGGYGGYRDTASVLSEVRYNCRVEGGCATRVVFVGTDFGTQPGDTPIFGPQGRLKRIDVYHAGRRVRYYQLEYETTYSPGGTAIRRLVSIREFSGDGSLSFPATTFGYQDFPNKGWCPPDWDCPHEPYYEEQFPYPRLVWVENGYGARTEFTYEDDGRADWEMPYNYRVVEMRTYDGVHADPARVVYAYGTRCYDQRAGDDYYTNGGVLCRGRAPEDVGPLVGHDVVTETVKGYGGGVLTQRVHRYYIDDGHSWRLGLEHRTERRGPEGELLALTEREWISTTLGTTTWAQLTVVTETVGTATTRTEYGYDDYGNATWEYRWGNVELSGDEVAVVREFVPNEEAWIVDRPGWEQVVSGEWGPVLRETRYLYDGQAWGITPTVGALTAVVVGLADLWITTTYEYDGYGNRTAVTDPLGRVTRTAYDPVYHLYPVSRTNPLGWTTLTEWDVALGVPEVVTEANGAATAYGYDGLGRLVSVTYPDPATGRPGAEPDVVYTYPEVVNGEVTAPFAIGQARRIGTGVYHHTWTIYDGLGRVVQEQEEAGAARWWSSTGSTTRWGG